jgi:hypothetical protein
MLILTIVLLCCDRLQWRIVKVEKLKDITWQPHTLGPCKKWQKIWQWCGLRWLTMDFMSRLFCCNKPQVSWFDRILALGIYLHLITIPTMGVTVRRTNVNMYLRQIYRMMWIWLSPHTWASEDTAENIMFTVCRQNSTLWWQQQLLLPPVSGHTWFLPSPLYVSTFSLWEHSSLLHFDMHFCFAMSSSPNLNTLSL